MGMVVRTNTMALNAYRQLGMNNSAVAKSLEKLSSGFRINRAGDDAAGLAISEKMKAQITGLETASANAQDGISLIQTAEGNLSEVHDMLNRMVELASKSANGTYTSTERQALQDEVDQLLDEIDRISQSANFNGTKLLDGSLDFKPAGETINATSISGNLRTGLYVPTVNDGTDDVPLIDGNTVGTDKCEQGWGLYTHKEATGEAKTSFDVRLSNYKLEGLTEGEEVTITLSLKNNKEAVNGYNAIAGTDDIDGVAVDIEGPEITVEADENGEVTGKMIADAVAKYYADNSDGKVTLKNQSGIGIEYSITSDGNSLKFEMTDKGYQDAAAAFESDPTNKKNWVFDGNYNVDLTTTVDRTHEFTSEKADATAKADIVKQLNDAGWTKENGNAVEEADLAEDSVLLNAAGQEFTVTGAFANAGDTLKMEGTVKVGQGMTDNSTSVTKKGTAAAGTQLADGLITPDKNGWKLEDFKDASGIQIGGVNYVFAATDDTAKAKFDANTKVVDIRDLVDEDGNIANYENVNTALHRLADAAADNKMWSVQVSSNGNMLAIREREDYNGNGEDGRADLTTREGIEKTIQFFDKARASSTAYEATGKSLTLQIGDTADDYNKMDVNIADMSATGLGLKDLSIMTEADASNAIDKVKNAINTVSTTRAGMGALQNRLEHTINNLDVAVENLSAANSRIRDTDMAKEMMNYTKMNVLVQSAQAMLAQANQQPQSVLQLLQ